MQQQPFILETKSTPSATKLASGELLVRGIVSRWGELDRVGDRMSRRALRDAIDEFMRRPNKPFLFEHNYKALLGQVTNLFMNTEGVVMEAKVAPQPESSPWRFAYDLLKAGALRATSLGGKFFRTPRADGTFDVHKTEILELSAVGVPALGSTSLEVTSVGEAKSLHWPVGASIDPADRAAALHRADAELTNLQAKMLKLRLEELSR